MPRFRFHDEQMEMEGSFFCPVGHRGFILSMKVKNLSAKSVYCVAGAETAWGEMLHHINLTKPLNGDRVFIAKSWEETPVLEWRAPEPKAALALYPPDKSSRFFYRLGKKALSPQIRETPLPDGEILTLQWLQSKDIKPNQYWETFFYFGLGPEEIGAFGSAREMQRVGGAVLRDQTRAWLKERRLQTKDPSLDPHPQPERLLQPLLFHRRRGGYRRSCFDDLEKPPLLRERGLLGSGRFALVFPGAFGPRCALGEGSPWRDFSPARQKFRDP